MEQGQSADIWLDIADKKALQHVRQMQANLQAECIYYWGQELAIYRAAGQPTPTAEAVRHAVQHVIKLPLLIPADRDYARMIDQVINNRRQRQLGIDVGCPC